MTKIRKKNPPRDSDLTLTNINKRQTLNKMNKAVSRDMIRAVEDELFFDSATIVNDSMKFAELSFDESGNVESYPQSWDTELTKAELQKRLRIAKANWMTSGEVPNGIKMAQTIAVGIMKARAAEDTGVKSLRIQNIVMTNPTIMKEFGEIEVEE